MRIAARAFAVVSASLVAMTPLTAEAGVERDSRDATVSASQGSSSFNALVGSTRTGTGLSATTHGVSSSYAGVAPNRPNPLSHVAAGLCQGVREGGAHPTFLEGCDSRPGKRAGNRVVTSALVATAFRSTPVPRPLLEVQPPGGETLVHIDTVFAAQAEPFERTFTLLGQQVSVAVRPAQFAWTFGDGESLSTTRPGRPITLSESESGKIPSDLVTHQYVDKENVKVAVAVTWSAQWRIGAKPWAPVPGTVTTRSAEQPVSVLEAKPQLMAH